ncbi:MAG: caspase family protein [Geminocystis sp.]|nr:caspase family protein [Geminocystis sp.]MCS7147428.1 caspase family protein [Geminocystis sp.]MDW8117161.1 caspase family protein [Geminocystis sp.]MDW8462584.1 caspase family protein [Geminocystis sp.]
MSQISRRSFLKGVSLSVASIYGWKRKSSEAIAANLTPANTNGNSNKIRKLALLVGINQYPSEKQLRGSITDVELQRELLIHRFGFSPQDIVTLTDKQATRENVLNAFQQLCKQASGEDVVVFHFSGYARQLKFFPDNKSPLVDSLILYDTIITTANTANDILLVTLLSLANSLATEKYTLILDTSFSPPTLSSATPAGKNLSLRFIYSNPELYVSEEEKNFYQSLNPSYPTPQSLTPNPRGMLLSPKGSLAIEIHHPQFPTGLFTYSLTQSLWQIYPDNRYFDLKPILTAKISSYTGKRENIELLPVNKLSSPPYNLPLDASHRGDAVVISVNPPVVELELVGLPLLVLYNYQLSSRFYVYGDVDYPVAEIQIISLLANKAKGIVIKGDINAIQPGLVCRESVRVISGNIKLHVALDDSLEKIEKVDATGTLSIIEGLEITNLGDSLVDCILGKFRDEKNTISGYAIYSPVGALYANTTPPFQEAVASAVKRLISPLRVSLTSKLLHLTENQFSSSLPLNVFLKTTNNNDKSSITYCQYTAGSKLSSKPLFKTTADNVLIAIPLSGEIAITISNEADYPLYFLLLAITPSRKTILYHCQSNPIQPLSRLTIPQTPGLLKWIIDGATGIGELFLVCSRFPFNNTLQQLQQTSDIKPQPEQIYVLERPDKIAHHIVKDLAKISQGAGKLNNNPGDSYWLELSQWATFRLVYTTVP